MTSPYPDGHVAVMVLRSHLSSEQVAAALRVIEQSGFPVVHVEARKLSREEVEKMYVDQRQKPWFDDLVACNARGTSTLVVGVCSKCRTMERDCHTTEERGNDSKKLSLRPEKGQEKEKHCTRTCNRMSCDVLQDSGSVLEGSSDSKKNRVRVYIDDPDRVKGDSVTDSRPPSHDDKRDSQDTKGTSQQLGQSSSLRNGRGGGGDSIDQKERGAARRCDGDVSFPGVSVTHETALIPLMLRLKGSSGRHENGRYIDSVQASKQSAPHSLRALFGENQLCNAVHCAGTVEECAHDISVLFPKGIRKT